MATTIQLAKASTLPPVGATLMKTGQTVSYRTGDDGDLEAGRATSFFVLASNNPFGNTNRFTDELGGATYTNNIVIDWSTYDGSTVLGYRRTILSVANWDTQIDNCLAVSIGTFTSGWRLANIREIYNIACFSVSAPLNYAPFNILLGSYLQSSTSSTTNSTYAMKYHSTGQIFNDPKPNSAAGMAVRTFTVTGTTLS